jgi:hypothetical protein
MLSESIAQGVLWPGTGAFSGEEKPNGKINDLKHMAM